MQIGTRRGIALALELFDDPLPGSKTDERLVLALDERDAPVWEIDVAGIDHTRKYVLQALELDLTARRLWPFRSRIQKCLHVWQTGEAPRGEAFERLGEDRSDRLIAHEQLAVPRHLLEFVASHGREDPIAVHGAGAHAVFDLLAVLLTLVLRDRGKQVLDQDGIRVLAELNRRAL